MLPAVKPEDSLSEAGVLCCLKPPRKGTLTVVTLPLKVITQQKTQKMCSRAVFRYLQKVESGGWVDVVEAFHAMHPF